MAARHLFAPLLTGAVLTPVAVVAIFGSTQLNNSISMATENIWVKLASQPFFTCALIFGALAMVSAHQNGGMHGFAAFMSTCVVGIGGMAVAQYAVPAIASASHSTISTQTMEIVLASSFGGLLLLTSIIAAIIGSSSVDKDELAHL